MPTDDLKQYATSSHDFYALLGITFETSSSDIRRAYRKTALKYHPDKVGNSPSALEKFHLLQIAYDVLSDPAVKALYDNARTARLQKQRQNELFEGKRRRMKEDLEARENNNTGVKRGREEDGEGEGPEERLEREVRRLAEDGKRRRREREEFLRRELRDEEERIVSKEEDASGGVRPGVNLTAIPQTSVPEIDRTVKVRWPREGHGALLDKDRLTAMFSRFGGIESSFLLKDKKQKTPDKQEKKLMAAGVIVYTSVIGAYAAVEDLKKQMGDEWRIFDSVFWAAGKEPDFLPQDSPSRDRSSPSTPLSTHNHATTSTGASFSTPTFTSTSTFSPPNNTTTKSNPNPNSPASRIRCHSCNRTQSLEWLRGPDGARTLCSACGLHYAKLTRKMASKAATGVPNPNYNIDTDGAQTQNLRKVPSFASFTNSSVNSPFGKGAAHSPGLSLEEVTMLRLRNAEKKRLEEEIRRGDEVAAAAATKGAEDG
ncbi:hypothetical protein MMC16_005819 [Acarospora aff. strigata]|nr:hypothetical protein [Acarospora aff. strigata]